MLDVITFGSATWDVFLKSKTFQAIENKELISKKGLCFNLGSKIEVDDLYFSSGGGGTNTAASFSSLGLKTAYCGMIGKDIAGNEVIRELKERKIKTELIERTSKRPTNFSAVLSAQNDDRTILAYRGAAELLKKIPYKKIKTKWIYLSPLSGRLAKITKEIVGFASKNNIKIALNPGNSQLDLPQKTLKEIISKVDVLILNQEEASMLTGIGYSKEKEIFKKIDDLCPGIAIMTKGPEGSIVSDGEYLYVAPSPEVKVADRTGAGDAYGSGFVSGYIKSKGNIEFSIQTATANAVSALKKVGAKNGLLKNTNNIKKVKIKKEKCLKNGLCKKKK